MPQLDQATFTSQAFWFLVTFLGIYMIFIEILLPSVARIIKCREYKLGSYTAELNQLDSEQKDFFTSKQAKLQNLLSTTEESCNSVKKDLNELVQPVIASIVEISNLKLLPVYVSNIATLDNNISIATQK